MDINPLEMYAEWMRWRGKCDRAKSKLLVPSSESGVLQLTTEDRAWLREIGVEVQIEVEDGENANVSS
jgi:hypothetical protein